MSTFKNINQFFAVRAPEDVERFVNKNLDISQQVYALIRKRGWTQKDFAKALGKSDAEVSKWLNGTHNLTLRSVAKMEAALGADIIITPIKAEKKYSQIKYVSFKVYASVNKPLSTQKGYEVSGSYHFDDNRRKSISQHHKHRCTYMFSRRAITEA